MHSFVNIVSFDDSRILGIDIITRDKILQVLNIYLPYYSNENYDLYLEYVGKISSIIEYRDHRDFIVLGDFNANVDGVFYSEWEPVCRDYDLSFADVIKLSPYTCTHINNSSLTASWLYHCLTTQTVFRAIKDLTFDNNYCGSDHFPMRVTLNYGSLPAFTEREEEEDLGGRNCINWNFENEGSLEMFYGGVVRSVSYTQC